MRLLLLRRFQKQAFDTVSLAQARQTYNHNYRLGREFATLSVLDKHQPTKHCSVVPFGSYILRTKQHKVAGKDHSFEFRWSDRGLLLFGLAAASLGGTVSECDNNESTHQETPKQDEIPQPKQRRRWLRFWYSSAGPKSSKSKDNTMFTSTELEEGLRRREHREEEIQWFRTQIRNRIMLLQTRRKKNEITDAELQMEMQVLKQEILLQAQKILYGVDEPGARQRYLEKYGCCAWNDEAMKEIQKHGKLIEIGAGGGQWQHELNTNWGVDIIAFDNGEQIPLPKQAPAGIVRKGDEQVIKHYPERTLMLVYPPPGKMALNCLRRYEGDILIYVGEGKGGCNGNDAFFEELCNNWKIEKEIKLDNFPECFEKLYIVRRKK